MEIDLGSASVLTPFPREVTVRDVRYYLTKLENQYVLLSRTCPHAGGIVCFEEKMLYCPLHMWTFDAQSGNCLNMPGHCLEQLPVEERNGHLFAIFSS